MRRLKAYEAAGADVVYAPGVTTEAEVRAIVEAVKVPVNVIGGLGGISNDIRGAREARREARLDRLGARQGRARRLPEGRAGAGATGRSHSRAQRRRATLNGAFARPRDEDEDD